MNTQPSDLESDALPLRHRVCHVGKHPGKKAQCFQDGPHQWFKVTSVRGWSCQCLKRLTVCGVYRAGQQTLDFVQASASTHTKIGSIQRRLAWPLRKDDTQIREAFRILLKSDCSIDPVFFPKISRAADSPLEMPRIELGASYMQSMRSTTELHPLGCNTTAMNPGRQPIFCGTGQTSSAGYLQKLQFAQRGARTHDPEIKSLMLYRLS